jgi:hypothetical protein
MQSPVEGTVPRLILTVGLHASASTWVFNVVRELMEAAFGPARVAPGFATTADDIAGADVAPDRYRVVKTHGWPDLPAFAREHGAAVFVSVRDPRDAVLSLMQRFGDSLPVSANGISHDCRCAHACADAPYPVLRYEDRFFADPASLPGMAAQLGLALPPERMDRIFRAWTTEAVRTIANGVTELPPERKRALGPNGAIDAATLVTWRHIGDARIGKWREGFDGEVGSALTRHFFPFLLRFGYSPA